VRCCRRRLQQDAETRAARAQAEAGAAQHPMPLANDTVNGLGLILLRRTGIPTSVIAAITTELEVVTSSV
jgi:hypothetical protein